MTFEELDVALEELETRLERLRALYEQYFLGFEKIEPSVARKDVDRRIYVLRREKIRNTGKRFKLQTIIQRYNTFQQYWQRICREIENGTYKRHLLLAKKQMDPGQQLTIASRRRFGRLVGPARASEPPPGGFPPDEAATIERPNQLESDGEELATRRPPPLAAEPALDPDERTERFVVPPPKPERLAPPKPERAAPPKPGRPAPARTEYVVPPKPEARPLSSQPPPRSPTAPKYDSLDMDMGFLGDWEPPPPGKVPPKPAGPPPAAAPPRAVPAAGPPRPAPPPTPRAAPPPKPAAPPPAAPPRAASLSDDRVKDLHDKLSELKRQNREAGQVSLESLKKTLHETESKLREKHQGRKIDFEVVVRDGKAIVKPTVR